MKPCQLIHKMSEFIHIVMTGLKIICGLKNVLQNILLESIYLFLCHFDKWVSTSDTE